jgi:putative transposase
VILKLIAEAKANGLPIEQACAVLGLSPRTVQRWQAPLRSLPVLSTSGARVAPAALIRPRPYNALTASEAAAVMALIRSPQHADSSCRELALALQAGPQPIFVSHVTIWEYERALKCNGPRGRQTFQGRGRTKPATDWVNGPNQLWDWDITYLHTDQSHIFCYLYSLLDHWSRKNIAWRISPHLASAEVQTLWDHGLINEGVLDQPTYTWPTSLSDRGAQMRSHSTTTYFRKLGIPQLFSRPRTPNDNPYIEAHFATIKTQPAFPGYFTSQTEAENYFGQFYPWYNDVHPHTRLNMLTPGQVHSGQGPRLLAERAALKAATLATRRANATSGAHTFTLEELIANHLPNVSDYPCYSWAGPENGSVKKATALD